mmetsp:Transcript_105482/g.303252  ORF Transcript_105482/g.303252 Transcript_105482/m.303252 type:complete len:647 (-) Transcript_105482:110-2050(-)
MGCGASSRASRASKVVAPGPLPPDSQMTWWDAKPDQYVEFRGIDGNLFHPACWSREEVVTLSGLAEKLPCVFDAPASPDVLPPLSALVTTPSPPQPPTPEEPAKDQDFDANSTAAWLVADDRWRWWESDLHTYSMHMQAEQQLESTMSMCSDLGGPVEETSSILELEEIGPGEVLTSACKEWLTLDISAVRTVPQVSDSEELVSEPTLASWHQHQESLTSYLQHLLAPHLYEACAAPPPEGEAVGLSETLVEMGTAVSTLDRQASLTQELADAGASSLFGSSPEDDRHASSEISDATSRRPKLQASSDGDHVSITVQKSAGLPGQAMLSFKVGEVQRQARAAVLRDRPMRLPASFGAGRPTTLGVTVLSVHSTGSLVLHPRKHDYCVQLRGSGGQAVLIKLAVSGHRGASLQSSEGIHGEVSQYLESHRLLEYVPAVLQAAIEERAEDPYDFIRCRIGDILRGELPFVTLAGAVQMEQEQSSTSPSATMELDLRVAEGRFPKGSMLLVSAGGERRRVRLSRTSEHKMHFSAAVLTYLKVEILVPEESKKVPLAFDRDLYSFRLCTKEGNPISIDLAVQMLPTALDQEEDYCADAGMQEDGQHYLNRHGLLSFAPSLFKGLVQNMPEDPYKFILEYVDEFRRDAWRE